MSLKDTFSRALGLEDIKYALIGLIEAKLELKKIELREQLGAKITDLTFVTITTILSLLLVIFVSILIAIGINILLDSSWYGFAIVTVIYSLLLIVWISNERAVKRQIDERVNESINKQMVNLKISI